MRLLKKSGYNEHGIEVNMMARLSNGQLVSYGNSPNLCFISEEGILQKTLVGHEYYLPIFRGGIGLVELSNKRLLTWAWSDPELLMWSLEGELIKKLPVNCTVNAVVELSNGRFASLGQYQDEIIIWTADGELFIQFERVYNISIIAGLMELGNGNFISWCNDPYENDNRDYHLRLWTKDGKFIKSIFDFYRGFDLVKKLNNNHIFAFTAGKLLLLDEEANILKEISLDDDDDIFFLSEPLDLPNGQFICHSADDLKLCLFSEQGDVLKIISAHSGNINGLKILSNGHILSWANDGTIKLWSDTLDWIWTLEAHYGPVGQVLELSDKRLISWCNGWLYVYEDKKSSDYTIKIWSLDGHLLNTLEGHTKALWAIPTHDDQYLLSWEGYDQIYLWDIKE